MYWLGHDRHDRLARSAGGGFAVGHYRERRKHQGKALTEYDFYPYVATPERFAEFSLKDFRLGVHYFLRNTDARAAG